MSCFVDAVCPVDLWERQQAYSLAFKYLIDDQNEKFLLAMPKEIGIAPEMDKISKTPKVPIGM
jgi:hypothetical protein